MSEVNRDDVKAAMDKMQRSRYKVGVPFQLELLGKTYYFITTKAPNFNKNPVHYLGGNPLPNVYKQFYDNNFKALSIQEMSVLKRRVTGGSQERIYYMYDHAKQVDDQHILAQLALVGGKLDKKNILISKMRKLIEKLEECSDLDYICKIYDQIKNIL